MIKGPVFKILGELAQVEHAFAIVYEALCNCGYLYEELSKVADRVAVAHRRGFG